MNSSSDSLVFILPSRGLNKSFESTVKVYELLGFLRITNYFYLFLYVPCSVVGFVLNTICLRILFRMNFRSTTYFYLRQLTFLSWTFNLLQIMFGFGMSQPTLSLGNRRFAQIYLCQVFAPLHYHLTFYKFVIDALVILDRLSKMHTRGKLAQVGKVLSYSPVLNSVIAFVISFALVWPQYLAYIPNSGQIRSKSDGSLIQDVHFSDLSGFARSKSGKLWLQSLNVLRSGTILIVDIVLNLVSIVKFRRYFSKKVKLLSMSKRRLNSERDLLNSNSTSDNTRYDHITKTAISEKSLTKMIIVLGTISVLHQIIYVANSVFIIFLGKVALYTGYSVLSSQLFSAFRHSTNFFVFYFFDKNFKREFNHVVRSKETRSERSSRT